MRIHPPFKNIKWDKTIQGGDVLQWFKENVALYKKAIGTIGHPGIDLYKPEGTPILGTAGTVIDVNDNPHGYGKHVRIKTDPDENGDYLLVTYGHGKNQCVSIGQRIEDGQKIAEVSNTGVVISGPNIYWGNAPANKGVHLHLNVHACNTSKGNMTSNFAGGSVLFKDYFNGYQGSIDPLTVLEAPDELKLKASLLQQIIDTIKKIKERI